MSSDYTLKFDLSSYGALDQYALLADQKYNLGDIDDWFGNFRGGLYGFYSRVTGVQIHYSKLHDWVLPDYSLPLIKLAEYHVSSIFFNMDSAIECMVFAINALGYIANKDQFLDITNGRALTKISPRNIIGKRPECEPDCPGYKNYFPSLQSYWCENRELLSVIFEQHDVSKHRSTIYRGGQSRNDPPPGFFEKLGIAGNKVAEGLFTPLAEVILSPEPKALRYQRKHKEYKDTYKLEEIAEGFCTFINMCGTKALQDAKTTIKLNYYDFIKQ